MRIEGKFLPAVGNVNAVIRGKRGLSFRPGIAPLRGNAPGFCMKRKALASEAALLGLVAALAAVILGLIFWSFDSTDPMWAIISFVLVYDPDVRVAFSSAISRLALTIFGSAIAMGAVFAFGLHKWVLPLSVAIAAVICGMVLRSRGSWRIVLVTVALIIGSSLLEPSIGSYIAVVRSIEVSSGSLLAVVFSWLVAAYRIRASPPPSQDGRQHP